MEVNGATLDILRRVYADYCRPWVHDPRVALVEDDGRHSLAASPELYDVIQLSGVDSYSGTAGAAHVCSENYLYTQEAFDLYLSRLSPQGVLNLMRLEWHSPREMLRALVMAVAALRRRPAGYPLRVCALFVLLGIYLAVFPRLLAGLALPFLVAAWWSGRWCSPSASCWKCSCPGGWSASSRRRRRWCPGPGHQWDLLGPGPGRQRGLLHHLGIRRAVPRGHPCTWPRVLTFEAERAPAPGPESAPAAA